MNKKVNIRSGLFLAILILIFLGLTIAYFFVFQANVQKKSATNAPLTVLPASDIDELELRKDMLRFLEVYFNQKFDNNEDKQIFVKKEYERFLVHSVATGAEQDLLARFISDLGQIMEQMKNKIFSNKTAEQDLLEIKNELAN